MVTMVTMVSGTIVWITRISTLQLARQRVGKVLIPHMQSVVVKYFAMAILLQLTLETNVWHEKNLTEISHQVLRRLG